MEDDDFKNPLTARVWGKVIAAFYERTDDSGDCKSFSTPEITDQFFLLSQAFASLIFSPQLSPEEIRETHIPPFFLFLMSVGKEVYLAERSIETLGKPYRVKTDQKEIKKMWTQSMGLLSKKVKVSRAGREVINEVLQRVNKDKKKREEEFKFPGRRLRVRKLQDFTHGSIYFGYVFTGKMVEYNP